MLNCVLYKIYEKSESSMNKFLTLFFIISLGGCVLFEDYQANRYRLEYRLQTLCSQGIGAQQSSAAYAECRIFYDKLMIQYGVNQSRPSSYQISQLTERAEQLAQRCRSYGLSQAKIWDCMQEQETMQAEEYERQKIAQEKEAAMQRSIASGLKEANEAERRQDMIDAERERVMKETGKRASEVDCKVYEKWNGAVVVKCH